MNCVNHFLPLAADVLCVILHHADISGDERSTAADSLNVDLLPVAARLP